MFQWLKKLEQIGEEITQRWPGTITTIVHRIGPLQISDIAVLIAVSSPHRKDAYRANEYAIERIRSCANLEKRNLGRRCRMARTSKRRL